MRTLKAFLPILVLLLINGSSASEKTTDDAVIVEASNITEGSLSRTQRHLLVALHRVPVRASWAGGEGYACITSLGILGSCQPYMKCYPYFKSPQQAVRFPVLNAWDSWVLGNRDTCNYYTNDGREAYGVCCLNPINPAPAEVEGNELNKIDFPIQSIQNIQSVQSWPPQIPTHPPDHAAPTHPPSHFGVQPVTEKPIGTTTRRTTTWATRPPVFGAPGQTTSRRPIFIIPTTESPIINDVAFDGGACGGKNGFQDQERIVGGQNADPNEWPWAAVMFNNGRQFCGGSLIDDSHILSAAHCVAHFTSWDVARLTVHLGDHNIRSNTELKHVVRKVKRVVRHRGFDSRTLYNDISILTLDQKVPFSKAIKPVCLPAPGLKQFNGLTATVVGWGSLRENGPQPSVLQEVTLPIWTNAECKQKYGAAAPGGIIESMLCAGQASKDSCSGDSGGPLIVNEGRWTQVGIVSWGIGCGKGQYPGVYTRITSFLPWIEKNIKEA